MKQKKIIQLEKGDQIRLSEIIDESYILASQPNLCPAKLISTKDRYTIIERRPCEKIILLEDGDPGFIPWESKSSLALLVEEEIRLQESKIKELRAVFGGRVYEVVEEEGTYFYYNPIEDEYLEVEKKYVVGIKQELVGDEAYRKKTVKNRNSSSSTHISSSKVPKPGTKRHEMYMLFQEGKSVEDLDKMGYRKLEAQRVFDQYFLTK